MNESISASQGLRWQRWGKDVIRRVGLPLAKRVWNSIPDKVHHPKPTGLGIALTRICNADCTFCAYQFLEKAERIHMPEDMFRRVAEQVADLRVRSVQLSPNLGDPLVAPRFLEKVAALRAAGVTMLYTVTNGILLDKVGIDAYLEDGPDDTAISMTAFDEAMYKRLYRSDQYPRVRRNVLELLRKNHARPAGKRRHICLRIRADVPRSEFMQHPDMQEAEALAGEIAWNVDYADWGGLIKPEHLTGCMTFEKMVPHENRPCEELYQLVIHPDGEILACACRNIHHDEDMSLGNIKEIDLRAAWERMDRVTSNWQNGKIPKTCATCTMYRDPALAWPGIARHAVSDLVALRRSVTR